MMQLAWALNWQSIPGDGKVAISYSETPFTNFWYNTNVTVAWTVTDSSTNSAPATGVAGFTQGWDSIPSDPYSQPHGGSGNSFYSGPQYPFATAGCLAVVGDTSCAGGSSSSAQGCHTAHVEAWDNQGVTTTSTYGPICYDSVAPTISVSNNPVTPASGWYKGSDAVTLTATDPGGSNASGIYKTYYAINSFCSSTSLGSCSVYTGPITISAQGYNYIWYFTEDYAGNFSTETYEYVDIDTTPPVTTATLGGTQASGKYVSDVQVTLTATDNLSGVAHTYYTLDGGSQLTYSAPFTVTAVGSHTLKFWAVDVAGNVEATLTTPFTIAGFPATMSSPVSGKVLGATNQVFDWTAGTEATEYYLDLGTTAPGSSNLYASGWQTATSATVTSLPAKAVTVYARLYSKVGGVVVYNDYTYTEAGTPAAMSTPAGGSTLGTSDVKFTWTAGYGATEYYLDLGTSAPGSYNLYASGWQTATSATVTSLPAHGATVYARLYSKVEGVVVYNDYTYVEQ
jgi:hypothetical protein